MTSREYNEAGSNHAGAGEWEPALACFRAAVMGNRSSAAYHNNACIAAWKLGLVDEAERYGLTAVELAPNSADFAANLGQVFEARGNFPAAAANYARALRAGGPPFLYRRLGVVLSRVYRFLAASRAIQDALELEPQDAKLWSALANLLCSAGRVSEAICTWTKAIDLDPGLHEAHSARLVGLHYLPDKQPEEIFAAHREWGAPVESQITELPPVRSVKNPRLRLGYLAPHPVKGAVAAFAGALYRHHDPGSFEVVHFSDATDPDPTWHATANLSNRELADLIRRSEIDVMIDLGGHTTATCRLLALAERPAPLQITMIGYPDTTGLTRIDYRVTDSIADPPGAERRHTERLMRLDPCFLCYTPPVDAPAVEERPAGAPFTFGCFNAYPKLNGVTHHAWARILNAVPASRLVLKSLEFVDPEVRDLAADVLREAGIDAARVDLLAPAFAQSSHLAEYGNVDIFLDPFPYNGTTTTCEALWMGVPGVTLAGNMHVARVGASLLHACGLEDWVTHSWDEYVERAVRAAHERESIRQARSAMRDRLSRSVLLDGAGYTRRFEQQIIDAVD
jgi:protein O-GlcNAc transferase